MISNYDYNVAYGVMACGGRLIGGMPIFWAGNVENSYSKGE